MNEVICLDSAYSTTRRIKCANPNVHNTLHAKFGSIYTDPLHLRRKNEGGLRKQGYFKYLSYSGEDPESSDDAICNKKNPLITVITVVFNGASTLEQTINSVISQSYDNIEYIIIDGGSTDGTLDIIKKYQHAIDYWISEQDDGIYDAWNKGLLLSNGEWVGFLGADDIYLENAIKSYVALISCHKDINLEYVSSRANLTLGSKILRTIGEPWNWKTFRRYMNVAHVGSLHNIALFNKYGLYDSTYKICGDYELLLRPRSNLHAAYLDSITVNMSAGGVSDSNFLVFGEAAKAKVIAGKRNALMSYIEKIMAVGKWKLRTWLWY